MQKTAYEMRISDCTSDVCSSDLLLGLGLPENLSPMLEMQLSQLWHGIIALIFIAIIIGHIYIGTIGMEGAFDAMSSGEVNLNWAKEHHALWVDELRDGGKSQPHADRKRTRLNSRPYCASSMTSTA